MANFYGTARTNYFKVKDSAKFLAWLETLSSVESLQHITVKGETLFGFASVCYDSGCFPTVRYDEETGDGIEIWWAEELSAHLADGEVAVMIEAGAEKLRYISGWARAIHSSGDEVFVNLDDICSKAYEVFRVPLGTIRTAEY